MKAMLCPFCGLATELPHESQVGCIAALNAEIRQIRHVLESVSELVPTPATAEDDERQPT